MIISEGKCQKHFYPISTHRVRKQSVSQKFRIQFKAYIFQIHYLTSLITNIDITTIQYFFKEQINALSLWLLIILMLLRCWWTRAGVEPGPSWCELNAIPLCHCDFLRSSILKQYLKFQLQIIWCTSNKLREGMYYSFVTYFSPYNGILLICLLYSLHQSKLRNISLSIFSFTKFICI